MNWWKGMVKKWERNGEKKFLEWERNLGFFVSDYGENEKND